MRVSPLEARLLLVNLRPGFEYPSWLLLQVTGHNDTRGATGTELTCSTENQEQVDKQEDEQN